MFSGLHSSLIIKPDSANSHMSENFAYMRPPHTTMSSFDRLWERSQRRNSVSGPQAEIKDFPEGRQEQEGGFVRVVWSTSWNRKFGVRRVWLIEKFGWSFVLLGSDICLFSALFVQFTILTTDSFSQSRLLQFNGVCLQVHRIFQKTSKEIFERRRQSFSLQLVQLGFGTH